MSTDTAQFSITTGQQYKYTCPWCGGGFNRPAWTDTSFGGMDVCPLCEHGLEKGWNK
jgi:hypothetical protein